MKSLRIALLILMFCLGWSHAFSQTPDFRVRLEGERLTLHAREQTLATILAILADQGIRIQIDPRINPKITASFDRRPIGSAMSSVLKSVDYALIWRKDKTSTASEPRLWEIRIFFKGQEERIRPLESANLTIVKEGDGPFHVKDVLLIRLTSILTDADLAALLDRLGATIIDVYEPLGILRLRLPHGSDVPDIAETLADYPGIQTAEPDYAYPLEGASPAASDQASVPPAPSQFASPGTTTVAVMDSGLQADYENSPYVLAAYDAVSPGAEVADRLGHGTQMTLLAAGAVNPLGSGLETPEGRPVVAIRAFDDNGFTSTYTLMRGIDYAIENGARVLSLSWGSETSSALLESATRYADAKGLILVAAAGNAPTGNPVYPAAYDNVIGVGALTPNGKKWDQSNFGDFVAVSAPGMADLPVGYKGDPGTYAGTSIATAYTARRVAAILDENPNADREMILRMLKEEK